MYVDEHYAKCDICKTKISHKTTMSNLKKHIERKHPLINLQPEVDDVINQPSRGMWGKVDTFMFE